jgi:hypothetical protein
MVVEGIGPSGRGREWEESVMRRVVGLAGVLGVLLVGVVGAATASDGMSRVQGDGATFAIQCQEPSYFQVIVFIWADSEGQGLFYFVDDGSPGFDTREGYGHIPRNLVQGNVNTGMSVTVDTATLEDFDLLGHVGGLVDVTWTLNPDGYRREFSGTETLVRVPELPFNEYVVFTGRRVERGALWEGTVLGVDLNSCESAVEVVSYLYSQHGMLRFG